MLFNSFTLAAVVAVIPAAIAGGDVGGLVHDARSPADAFLDARQFGPCDQPRSYVCGGDVPGKCAQHGFVCCKDGDRTCPQSTQCLDRLEGSVKPDTPDGYSALSGQVITCCPRGMDCSRSNWVQEWFQRDNIDTNSPRAGILTGVQSSNVKGSGGASASGASAAAASQASGAATTAGESSAAAPAPAPASAGGSSAAAASNAAGAAGGVASSAASVASNAAAAASSVAPTSHADRFAVVGTAAVVACGLAMATFVMA